MRILTSSRLESIERFLGRLDVYRIPSYGPDPTAAMGEIIVK